MDDSDRTTLDPPLTAKESTSSEYHWSDSETPTNGVVRAVASVLDTDPFALDPLAETIDPETLNRLADLDAGGRSQPEARISFHYMGCHVTVHSAGSVTVNPAHEE